MSEFYPFYSAVQWLLAIVGAGLSGAVIVLTLLPVLRANAAKGSSWIQLFNHSTGTNGICVVYTLQGELDKSRWWWSSCM